jgi:DNA-binding beta-propeller fold protein YncE/mono/diheme cytochrome c family protein
MMAFQPDFAHQGQPVGSAQAPAATHRSAALAGSSVATFQGDVLVVDADSGHLIRTDRAGTKIASLRLGPGAAQVVVDDSRKLAYVSDRTADRVVLVDLSRGLRQVDAFTTKTEPYGLALSPDGSTLLVTTVADETLSALDTASGLERWSLSIGTEPRGVAIAPHGREALVTFLTTGVVARVDLSRSDRPSVDYVSLDPVAPATPQMIFGASRGPVSDVPAPDQGRSFARNAFAALYVGNEVAVVPHQLSTPHLASDGFEQSPSGGYGGGSGFTPPVVHRLAFLSLSESAEQRNVTTAFATTNVHQPRAMAYDGTTDTLYLAGYGSDEVAAVANISQASVRLGWKRSVTMEGGCGPDGLAVDASDGSVVVFCSLTRKTVRIEPGDVSTPTLVSAELASSRLSASAQRGQEVFRRGNTTAISSGGAMACASCHAEVRADGLSWFLQGNRLQTPLLAGRVMGSHPFKWDGKDRSLKASLVNTVGRLGGDGLTSREVKDLQAFLASVEPPRAPAVEDHTAVARGKALFESSKTACANCHYGPLLTDQKLHAMAEDLGSVDTPSLVGLATSAPYYHDGSAQTLYAVLEGKGSIHGMGRTSRLSDGEIDDLVAYMQTL